jgi:hypothetical protein
MFSEIDIIKILYICQQTVVIPLGAHSASILANWFLYSNEADLIQGFLKKNEKKLARSFNATFPNIKMMSFH